MGYPDQLAGGITFDPPVTYKEFRDTNFWKRSGDQEADRLVWLDIVEESGETDDGPVTIRRAVGIRPADDEVRADNLAREIREIISAFCRTSDGGDRAFQGEILVYHDGSPVSTVRRVRVCDASGLLAEETAKLVWPDGTDVRFL